MVSRQSDAKDFGRVNQPGIQQTRIGNAPIDENQFRTAGNTRAAPAPESGGFDLMDSLLRVIAPAAKQLENANFEVEKEKSYLRGQAAAATQMSEDSIEADPLTRDWARAGYRDTVGKLAAADSEAQLAADMVRLRQEPPEKFAEYLAQRRESLADQHGSMSLPARKAMFTQQLTSDQAAIAKHSSEYKNFIADVQLKQHKATIQTALSKLDAARKTPDSTGTVYATAAASTFEVVKNSFVNDLRVPYETRLKMTEEVMSAALETGHPELFNAFTKVEVDFEDGSRGSMFSRLSFPAQEKLTKSFEAAQTEVSHLRSADAWKKLGQLERAIANGENVSVAEVEAFVYAGVNNEYWKPEKANSVIMSVAKGNAEAERGARASAAVLSGNIQAAMQYGSREEVENAAVKDVRKRMAKQGLDLGQMQAEWLRVGTTLGVKGALNEFADNLRPALNLLTSMPQGTKIDSANADIVRQAVQALGVRETGQEKYGNELAVINAALGPELAEKLSIYREQLQPGTDPVLAATLAGDEWNRRKSATPQMKAIQTGIASDDVRAILEESRNPGAWTGFKDKTLDILGIKSARMATQRDYTFWSSSQGPAARENQLLDSALIEELGRGIESRTFATKGERQEMAQAAVFARTIPVGTGFMLTPRIPPGVTMQSLFGLGNENFSPEIIGQAVEKLTPLRHKDNYRVFNLGSSNTITWEEFSPGSPQAIPGGARAINMAVVGQQARALRAAGDNKDNSTHGSGVTARVGEGEVKFNGTNSVVGLHSELMLDFRKELVSFEGFDSTPRKVKSTGGTELTVVGVGIASSNDFYPKVGLGPNGSITPQQLDKAFHNASNAAAGIAMRAAVQVGVSNNPAAFKLFGHMAYQTNDFTKKKGYGPFLRALQSGSAELAKAEFRKSDIFKDAQGRDKDTGRYRTAPTDPLNRRSQHYLDLIDKVSTKPKGREVVGVIN